MGPTTIWDERQNQCSCALCLNIYAFADHLVSWYLCQSVKQMRQTILMLLYMSRPAPPAIAAHPPPLETSCCFAILLRVIYSKCETLHLFRLCAAICRSSVECTKHMAIGVSAAQTTLYLYAIKMCDMRNCLNITNVEQTLRTDDPFFGSLYILSLVWIAWGAWRLDRLLGHIFWWLPTPCDDVVHSCLA